MRRKRHFIGRNHVLAGALADLRHVDTLGADDRTLTAERTGVHGLVERVVAHYYLSVVIYLPRQQTGVFFIVLEIGAGLMHSSQRHCMQRLASSMASSRV